jgi:DNA-binding LytR/AlgR family response regulator
MPTALIAEDEPLLAQALRQALAQAWPELQILVTVGDGASAVAQALQLRPDVLFLDIRMPGQSGIDAAADIADRWEEEADGVPFPALVFVTAYEQYAVQAFEAQAVDYLLKPLQPERLRKTVDRLREALGLRDASPTGLQAPPAQPPVLEQVVDQLRHLLAGPGAAAPTTAYLTLLQASVGNAIHIVPVNAVLLLEATDKYVRVLTAEHEYLIRTPLRELLPQLDPNHFWQIHRSHVVRVAAIDTVTRDEAGKLWLHLHERPERIAVSRLHAYRFKAM